MAILINRNTTQAPMTAGGTTGKQVLKFIQAPRVYVKAADSQTSTPVQSYFTKSNGATPSGWTDLGIVEGKAKIGVEKKVKQVTTGIDNYFRTAYTDSKVGTLDFTLDQFDDVIIGQITGITASVITAGSVVSYNVGTEDLTQLAILLVVQNKLDQKEVQFYNPNAFLNFSFDDSSDQLTLKVMGLLPFFSPNGGATGTNGIVLETYLATTIFA